MKIKELLKTYWVFLVIGAMALIIIISIVILRPNPNRELKHKFERERKALNDENKLHLKRIKALMDDSIAVRTQMAERSKREEENRRKSDEEYKKLQRRKDKIDLRGVGNAKLDSLRAVILSN